MSEDGRMRVATIVPVFLAACVKQLPPAPVPPAVVPPMQPAPPPPEGQARLLVDVVDSHVPVQRVMLAPYPGRKGVMLSEKPQPLCAPSPCAVDLPFGNVALGFPVIGDPDALEVELVHVGPDSSVYRRSLSVYDDRTGALRVIGIIAASVGGASAITGTALLPIGLSDGNTGLTAAGGITLGAGAALLALGIWAIRTDAPTYRPGSANHFALPR
jgi:hypothetical protein